MNPKTDAGSVKPRFALAVATSLGLGYLPKAPGTFGSLMGVLLAWSALVATRPGVPTDNALWSATSWWSHFALAECALGIAISVIGIWAASRVATYLRSTDPQIVVIDEVAGQLISYLGLATPRTIGLNWKYLLLGLILFRVFDIWKPFPARQAESFPGGLGVMADDWIAGVYAALVLGFVRYFGF
jgi:phosphatidylglycerophosphatase A